MILIAKKTDKDINNKLFIRSTIKNDANNIFQKGIENLLNIQKDFPRNDFYIKKTIVSPYSEKIDCEELDKIKLCDWVCNKLEKKDQLKYFNNFKKLVENIKDILF